MGIPEGSVKIPPDVGAARAICGPGLLHKRAPDGDAIDLPAPLRIPPSHNHCPEQHVLVAVVDLHEQAQSLAAPHAHLQCTWPMLLTCHEQPLT